MNMKALLINPTVHDFRAGDRVELHPATDLWMRGARYGDVVRVTGQRVHVRLDATGRTVRVAPSGIGALV